jgi:hypothetical protein
MRSAGTRRTKSGHNFIRKGNCGRCNTDPRADKGPGARLASMYKQTLGGQIVELGAGWVFRRVLVALTCSREMSVG